MFEKNTLHYVCTGKGQFESLFSDFFEKTRKNLKKTKKAACSDNVEQAANNNAYGFFILRWWGLCYYIPIYASKDIIEIYKIVSL